MIMFRVEGTKPVAVECPEPSWPNKDADGETIFNNTHFVLEGETWEKLRSEHEATLRMAAGSLRSARARVDELTKELADVVLEREECERNFDDWSREPKRDAP